MIAVVIRSWDLVRSRHSARAEYHHIGLENATTLYFWLKNSTIYDLNKNEKESMVSSEIFNDWTKNNQTIGMTLHMAVTA